MKKMQYKIALSTDVISFLLVLFTLNRFGFSPEFPSFAVVLFFPRKTHLTGRLTDGTRLAGTDKIVIILQRGVTQYRGRRPLNIRRAVLR